MKALCLCFQVHQALRLRQYRFFDIGNEHYYYDDYTNESFIRKLADTCYLPANAILYDLLIAQKGKFKLSFSISGLALDQFEIYTPEVIESFQKLATTGYVEFLAETDSHSLVSLKNKAEFSKQIKSHAQRIENLFGQKPQVFKNTALIYSDKIGETIAELGFKGILVEGAQHILGWKSPNYLYSNPISPGLKVLMRNYKLSNDIALRFTFDSGLTTEKFVDNLNKLDDKEQIVNIFIDYETFGEHHLKERGIFEFLRHLPESIIRDTGFQFNKVSEVVENYVAVSDVHIPIPIACVNDKQDLSPWLGNHIQNEAYNKLYELQEAILKTNDERLKKDWRFLQASDHFYFMCTNPAANSHINPYESPYEAFINYMNILSDFKICLKEKDTQKMTSKS
ncbi:glycoside hydrolase family 57 protein [Ancylomarina sp.]|uniref:glycoside hydrolase family 57 protein n=1 Tax=Ancylomarina sp. TaxID=1970196 RepID=UPI003565FDAA